MIHYAQRQQRPELAGVWDTINAWFQCSPGTWCYNLGGRIDTAAIDAIKGSTPQPTAPPPPAAPHPGEPWTPTDLAKRNAAQWITWNPIPAQAGETGGIQGAMEKTGQAIREELTTNPLLWAGLAAGVYLVYAAGSSAARRYL